MRLGIISSHPIQYHAPWFRAIAEHVDLHVYFAHRPAADDQAEAGFGTGFQWDCDLTGGYRFSFLHNVAKHPGLIKFHACDTPEVGGILAANAPDVVVVLGWHFKTYMQATVAARRLNIPVMTRTDSHLDAPRHWSTRLVKSVAYPIFLRQFDFFLPAGSRSVAYLKHYRVPAARIRVVPPCVDVAGFRIASREALSNRERLRTQWGIRPDSLALLFVGKLIDLKRPGDVIEAAARLIRDNHHVHVVFVGTGALKTELRTKAASAKVPVTFTGFLNQSRLPEVYAAADLLVLPSESESWGLAVNEAFACGLPAIVSERVGCAPDLIESGVTGSIFQTGNDEALASAIRDWQKVPKVETLKSALEAINQRYSPQAAADALIKAATYALGTDIR